MHYDFSPSWDLVMPFTTFFMLTLLFVGAARETSPPLPQVVRNARGLAILDKEGKLQFEHTPSSITHIIFRGLSYFFGAITALILMAALTIETVRSITRFLENFS